MKSPEISGPVMPGSMSAEHHGRDRPHPRLGADAVQCGQPIERVPQLAPSIAIRGTAPQRGGHRPAIEEAGLVRVGRRLGDLFERRGDPAAQPHEAQPTHAESLLQCGGGVPRGRRPGSSIARPEYLADAAPRHRGAALNHHRYRRRCGDRSALRHRTHGIEEQHAPRQLQAAP